MREECLKLGSNEKRQVRVVGRAGLRRRPRALVAPGTAHINLEITVCNKNQVMRMSEEAKEHESKLLATLTPWHGTSSKETASNEVSLRAPQKRKQVPLINMIRRMMKNDCIAKRTVLNNCHR